MKYLSVACCLLIIVSSCDQQVKEETSTEKMETVDSIPIKIDSPAVSMPMNKDSQLVYTSRQVLQALKNNDFKTLASLMHPSLGTRFSPYGYIDTQLHRILSAQQLIDAAASNKKMLWGYYDGSGDSILLGVQAYFKKFVYNQDFLHANKTSLNKMIGGGNSLNNLQAVYKNEVFTESYFPGFDPKYNGMDWCALRLVYQRSGDNLYLVAIVHDQWTT